MSIFYLPVPLYPSNALTSYGLLQRFFGVRSFYCMVRDREQECNELVGICFFDDKW